jgi:hypothetical protein
LFGERGSWIPAAQKTRLPVVKHAQASIGTRNVESSCSRIGWGTIMNTDNHDVLLPEWPGDWNETIGRFLEEYRRQARRKRIELTCARLTFGFTAASAFFVAAWPFAKTALG